MSSQSKKQSREDVLKVSYLETPLGRMIAVANEDALFSLEFVDRKNLEQKAERLRHKTGSAIISGQTKQTVLIEKELDFYFKGKLKEFKTPMKFLGTPFQIQVWEELMKIPHGETRSYSDIAHAIGKPTAFRAVAQSNGRNPLAIIVPCHRVINLNGDLGGYSSGLDRKKWLLSLEKN